MPSFNVPPIGNWRKKKNTANHRLAARLKPLSILSKKLIINNLNL